MSNCAINIRILFWHFQITKSRKIQFRFNPYHWENWRAAIRKPVQVYEWKPGEIGSCCDQSSEKALEEKRT